MSLPIWPNISSGVLNVSQGVPFQVTWTSQNLFQSYDLLKQQVQTEYALEAAKITNLALAQTITNTLDPSVKVNIDPFIFDLYNAISLVEQYGEVLEDLIWVTHGVDPYTGQTVEIPGRYDMCECQNMFRCPNGTVSLNGAKSIQDCTPERVQILRRISVIPSYYTPNTTISPKAGTLTLANTTDYWELSGADYSLPNGPQSYNLGTIRANTFDVIVITIDLTRIHYNLTYGADYRVGLYVNCKPCPAQYYCDYTNSTGSSCTSPSFAYQQYLYNQCLDRFAFNKYNLVEILFPI